MTPPVPPRKVPANPDIPKLSKSKELRLLKADDVSAAGYDAIEEAREKLVGLAKDVEDGTIKLIISDEDSAVHHIVTLTNKRPPDET